MNRPSMRSEKIPASDSEARRSAPVMEAVFVMERPAKYAATGACEIPLAPLQRESASYAQGGLAQVLTRPPNPCESRGLVGAAIVAAMEKSGSSIATGTVAPTKVSNGNISTRAATTAATIRDGRGTSARFVRAPRPELHSADNRTRWKSCGHRWHSAGRDPGDRSQS